MSLPSKMAVEFAKKVINGFNCQKYIPCISSAREREMKILVSNSDIKIRININKEVILGFFKE
jgi:hypothetical protein